MTDTKTKLHHIEVELNNYSEQRRETDAFEQRLRDMFTEYIGMMPAIPGTLPIAGPGNMMTVSASAVFSDPNTTLSADYYCTETQKKQLINIIKKNQSVEGILKTFAIIKETGKDSSKNLYHPHTRDYIGKLPLWQDSK